MFFAQYRGKLAAVDSETEICLDFGGFVFVSASVLFLITYHFQI